MVSVRPSHPTLQFLQSGDKMSITKVAWYVFRVKNMHSGSPLHSWGPWGQEKPSYVHSIIRRGEAKLRISKLTSVFHCRPSPNFRVVPFFLFFLRLYQSIFHSRWMLRPWHLRYCWTRWLFSATAAVYENRRRFSDGICPWQWQIFWTNFWILATNYKN